MKKVYYSIIIELRKNIINYGFFMCIIITAILCFTSEIYIDPITGQEYSVIAVITNMNQFSSDELTAVNILHDSVSPYITIFLPVISSIPFISVFCSERISGNMRFIISRISRYKYYISKFISAAFSGGFSVMLGFILYSSIILLMFENNSCSITELLKIYAGMGIYGMFSVAPAFFISSFVKNKYIICCFPFILMHFYYTFLSKIQDILISNDKWDIMVKMSFLYPSGLKEIFFNTDVYNLAYNFLLTIAAFGGFVYIMNRRVDYGQ